MIAIGWPLLFISLTVCSIVLVCSSILANRTVLADNPNDRSSHTKPISRAGGVAIILAWCVGLVLSVWLMADVSINISFIIVITLAAVLGLIDDLFQLKPIVKFTGQFFLALMFVTTIGVVSVVPVPFFGEQSLGIFAIPLNIFWILGMANAYNFMDGLNGIAAGVGALVLLVIAILAVPADRLGVLVMAFPLAIALCAFLPQNLLQGKIFMGDVGSHGVSFAIAGFAILISKGSTPGLSALLVPVLMLPFIADVTFTLFHRILRKQNIARAHREHIYQLLMRQGLSHVEVTGIYVGATALCAAAAIIMMRIPASWQWLVPCMLLVVMLLLGVSVYKSAKSAGLLTPVNNEGAAKQSDDESMSQPAE